MNKTLIAFFAIIALCAGCIKPQAPTIVPSQSTGAALGASCGGAQDKMCSGAENYCAKPKGQCQAVGQCQTKPEMCTMEYAPVCGCDGNTYSSSCVAASKGVSVAHEGPCDYR